MLDYSEIWHSAASRDFLDDSVLNTAPYPFSGDIKYIEYHDQ